MVREGVGGEGGGEMKCTRKVIRSTFTGQKAGIGDGDTSTCGLFGRVGGSGGGVGGREAGKRSNLPSAHQKSCDQ